MVPAMRRCTIPGKWMSPGYDIPGTECVKETERALICVAPRYGKFVIPKSQLTVDSEVHSEGDRGELRITEWIAIQKGWL